MELIEEIHRAILRTPENARKFYELVRCGNDFRIYDLNRVVEAYRRIKDDFRGSEIAFAVK